MKMLRFARFYKIVFVCIFPLILGSVLSIKGRQRAATRELRWALGRGDYPAVRKWAAQAGDVNVLPLTLDGSPVVNTPLISALEHDDTETIRLLLQKGANPNETIPGWGDPCAPLMIAVEHSNAEAVEMLIEHGASHNIGYSRWNASGLDVAENISRNPYEDWRMVGFGNHKKASPSQMASRKRIVWLLKQSGAFSRQKH